MGNTYARDRSLNDQEILILSQQSGLPAHIIQQLFEAFMERAGRDGRMTIAEFKACYLEINPNANMMTFNNDAERIFLMFDTDRNGVLTFDEFMMAYILLQQGINPVNRWQQVMNISPPNIVSRPGYINAAEALSLLQHMQRFSQAPNFNPAMQHPVIWNQLGPSIDPTGYVSQADFLRILAAQPQIQPLLV